MRIKIYKTQLALLKGTVSSPISILAHNLQTFMKLVVLLLSQFVGVFSFQMMKERKQKVQYLRQGHTVGK